MLETNLLFTCSEKSDARKRLQLFLLQICMCWWFTGL